jgi:hypothetical protein
MTMAGGRDERHYSYPVQLPRFPDWRNCILTGRDDVVYHTCPRRCLNEVGASPSQVHHLLHTEGTVPGQWALSLIEVGLDVLVKSTVPLSMLRPVLGG